MARGRISAILQDAALPFIEGYKPRGNYQKLLADTVHEWIADHSDILELVAGEVGGLSDALLPTLVEPPPRSAAKPVALFHSDRPAPNYVALAKENAVLGRRGEVMVCAYESDRLANRGRGDLAKRVEHVAVTRGDGLGYDVRSYEPDGSELHIEVKTTKAGRSTSFFVTKTELECSKSDPDSFRLYRLSSFASHPELFVLVGDISSHLRLEPTVYRAAF